MKDFILGTLFGSGMVAGVYFGWVHFDFQVFGISINSSQLENASAAQCREEIKRANQRAFAADKIAEELRNRALIAEQQLNQHNQLPLNQPAFNQRKLNQHHNPHQFNQRQPQLNQPQ